MEMAPRTEALHPSGSQGDFLEQHSLARKVLVVVDEVWIYFAGLDVSHKEQLLLNSNGTRTRAVLRLDGFLSADAEQRAAN